MGYAGVNADVFGAFLPLKVAPKMRRPCFYALLRAFFKLHISHFLIPPDSTKCGEDYIHSFIDEHERGVEHDEEE